MYDLSPMNSPPTSYNSLDQYTASGVNTYGSSTNNERPAASGTTVANGITGVLSTKTGTAAPRVSSPAAAQQIPGAAVDHLPTLGISK